MRNVKTDSKLIWKLIRDVRTMVIAKLTVFFLK